MNEQHTPKAPSVATSKSRLRRLITWLFTLILCVFIGMVSIVFTNPGNRLIAFTLEQLVSGLSIEIEKGTFFDGSPFNLEFNNDDLALSVYDVAVDISLLNCKGVCVDTLSLSSAEIELKTLSDTSTPNPIVDPVIVYQATAPFSLPIDVYIENVRFNNIQYRQPNLDVTLESLELIASLTAEQLTIAKLALGALTLAIENGDSTEAKQDEAPPTFAPIPSFYANLPLNIVANEISLESVSINQGPPVLSQFKTALSAKQSSVVIEQLSVIAAEAQINAHGEMTLAQHNPINASVNLQYQGQTANVAVSGALDALKINTSVAINEPIRISSAPNNSIELAANSNDTFVVNGEVNLKQVNYPFDLALSTNALDLSINNNDVEQKLAIAPTSIALTGNASQYSLTMNNTMRLDALPVVALNLLLEGGIESAEINTLTLTTENSDVTLAGNISWHNALTASIMANAKNIALQDVLSNYTSALSLNVKADFMASGDQWQADISKLNVDGVVNNIPVNMAANLRLDSNLDAKINTLTLSSAENYLSLAGEIAENWQLAGNVSLTNSKAIHEQLTGHGKGTLQITGKRATPRVAWDLYLSEIAFQSNALTKLVSTGHLDIANNFKTDIAFELNNLVLANQSFNRATINVGGDLSAHELNMQLEGQTEQLALALSGGYQNNRYAGKIIAPSLAYKSLTLSTDKPVEFTLNTQNQELSLNAHCWMSLDSKVCIEKSDISAQSGVIALSEIELAMSELNPFLTNVSLFGELTGKSLFAWQNGKLSKLELTLNDQNLSFEVEEEGEAVHKVNISNLGLTVVGDEHAFTSELAFYSDKLGAITSQITVNDVLDKRDLTGFVTLDKLMLSEFEPFIRQIDTLAGQVSAKMNLSGSLAMPVIDGEIDANGIAVSGKGLPVTLVNSDIHAGFNHDSASLQARLFDETGGTLVLNGDASWPNNQLQAQLQLEGDSFQLAPQTGVNIAFTPNIAIAFNQNLMQVNGKIVVPSGRVKLNSLPQGAVQASSDEVIITKTGKKSSQLPFDYELDLTVEVKDRFTVDSFGLTSFVKGGLKLTKTAQTPLLAVGDVNLIDGYYRAFGQELMIDTGQVGFNGAIDKPYLNIRAIRNPDYTDDGVIAGVKLTGNVSAPSLVVFSEPKLDEAVALSYLLSGHGIGEGDSSADGMLTNMLLAKGLARGEGTVNKLGEAVGIKDVSLSSRGSGDETKVEITGYVAPGIQVRYSIGIFDSMSEVAVRYQLMPRLYIEATSGLNDALDILYKFDWD